MGNDSLKAGRSLAVLLGLIAFVACRTDATAPSTAAVYFVLDAPLCSSVLPVQFTIDNIPVGTDTFRVQLLPEHLTSAAFITSIGSHALGAKVTGGAAAGYRWPDMSVTLAGGAKKADTLSFYCS